MVKTPSVEIGREDIIQPRLVVVLWFANAVMRFWHHFLQVVYRALGQVSNTEIQLGNKWL